MSDNLNNDFEGVSEFKFVMLPQWLLEKAYEGKPLPSKAIHLYSCLMYYANNDTRQHTAEDENAERLPHQAKHPTCTYTTPTQEPADERGCAGAIDGRAGRADRSSRSLFEASSIVHCSRTTTTGGTTDR